MYDPTAELFASFIDLIAQNNFVPVDGGQYQAKIIAPAINGIVVPCKRCCVRLYLLHLVL